MPAFAFRIPSATTVFTELYVPVLVYWSLIILALAFLSRAIHKQLSHRTLMIIDALPFVVFFGFIFLGPIIRLVFMPSDYINVIAAAQFFSGLIFLAIVQVIMAFFVLKILFYMQGVKWWQKVLAVLLPVVLILYFMPKETINQNDNIIVLPTPTVDVSELR